MIITLGSVWLGHILWGAILQGKINPPGLRIPVFKHYFNYFHIETLSIGWVTHHEYSGVWSSMKIFDLLNWLSGTTYLAVVLLVYRMGCVLDLWAGWGIERLPVVKESKRYIPHICYSPPSFPTIPTMCHKGSLGLGCCTAAVGAIYSITETRFDIDWEQLLDECKTFYFATNLDIVD